MESRRTGRRSPVHLSNQAYGVTRSLCEPRLSRRPENIVQMGRPWCPHVLRAWHLADAPVVWRNNRAGGLNGDRSGQRQNGARAPLILMVLMLLHLAVEVTHSVALDVRVVPVHAEVICDPILPHLKRTVDPQRTLRAGEERQHNNKATAKSPEA